MMITLRSARSAALVAGTLAALCTASCTATPVPVQNSATRPPAAPGSAPASPPALAVPPVTGPDHVGTVAFPVLDASRHRELMIQVWYPTLATHGRPAAYYPPRVAQLVATADHVPASVTSTVVTHAFQATKPVPGRHPVVLYSPGSSEMRNDATALTEELASRGFVTVGIDHTGESQFVQFPDGHVVRGTFRDTGTASNTREVSIRVADIAAVLRDLPAINRHGLLAGTLDLRHIGMAGFSLGGATTASAMRHLPALQAGLDLDGALYGDAVNTPLNRPFLLLGSDWLGSGGHDDTWQSGWRELSGFRREIELRLGGHLSYTDIAYFIDSLGLRSRYSPADQRLLLGSIPAPAAISATGNLVTAYFDYFLKGDRQALAGLNMPSQLSRYLVRIR